MHRIATAFSRLRYPSLKLWSPNPMPPASGYNRLQWQAPAPSHWQPTASREKRRLVSGNIAARFPVSLLAAGAASIGSNESSPPPQPPGLPRTLQLTDVASELNRKGHLAAFGVIRQLAEKGDADLNSTLDEYGNTPAHYLAYMADKLSVEDVVFFIAKGIDFYVPNCFGDTPIMRASRIHVSKAPIVEMIKGCGKDGETKGRPPITGCVYDCWHSYESWNNPNEIDQMIQERIITPYLRDNIGWTAFHYLARHGMHSQLKKLHDVAIAAADGSEAKARELINATDGYGDSPLSDAAYWDKYETTELLLNLGANPNVVNKLGQTPAHRAIISNLDNPSLKVAKLLIDRTDIRHMRDMPSQLELHEGKHIREIIEYITRVGSRPILHPCGRDKCRSG